MKKNLKSLLAITLASTLVLSLGTSSVYASDVTNIDDVAVKDIVINYNTTFFLLEDNTLWVNDSEGNYVQIYENVRNIYPSEHGDVFVILEDNTLLSGYVYTYDSTVEQEFQEVAKDVKFAAGNLSNLYLIKTDDTLWQGTFESNYSAVDVEKVPSPYPVVDVLPVEVSTEKAEVEVAVEDATTEATVEVTEKPTSEVTEVSVEETTEVTEETGYTTTSGYTTGFSGNTLISVGVSTSVSSTIESKPENLSYKKIMDNAKSVDFVLDIAFIIDNNNTLWAYGTSEYGMLGNLTFDTPVSVMDNVAEVEVNYNSIYILDTSNNLFTYDTYTFKDSLENKIEPTLVMDNVTSIDSMDNGYLVVKEDGSLWASGSNFNRSLGFDSDYSDELIQIDKDVAEVYCDYGATTIYEKNDGSFWGMGENRSKQLGYFPYVEEEVFFDEDGKYYMMSDVADMFFTYSYSVVTKTDGSLWKIGVPYYNELPKETEVKLIAEDVKFASTDGDTIEYVTGDNYDLFLEDGYIYLYQGDNYETASKEILASMGYELSETYTEDEYYGVFYELSLEEQEEFSTLLDEYVKAHYSSTPIASDVTYAEGSYYIDSNNNLYKINISGDNELIAEDVKDFSIDQFAIYIVNTEKELLCAELYDTETINTNVSFDEYSADKDFDTLGYVYVDATESIDENGAYTTTITFYKAKDKINFEPTGLANIEDINFSHFEYLILDTNGVLSIYTDYYYLDDTVENLKLGYKDCVLQKTIEGVKSFASDFSNIAYVTEENELWAMGSNYYGNFGPVEKFGEYIEEPVKISDNVEKVSLSHSDTLLLTTDSDLYGMGQNSSGQLGFKPQGYIDKRNTVMVPTKLTFNFITK